MALRKPQENISSQGGFGREQDELPALVRKERRGKHKNRIKVSEGNQPRVSGGCSHNSNSKEFAVVEHLLCAMRSWVLDFRFSVGSLKHPGWKDRDFVFLRYR